MAQLAATDEPLEAPSRIRTSVPKQQRTSKSTALPTELRPALGLIKTCHEHIIDFCLGEFAIVFLWFHDLIILLVDVHGMVNVLDQGLVEESV